jgi:hypothetical protein
MSIRKKVSIKNAILQAIDLTQDDNLRQLPVLMKWAKQSYMRIAGYASCHKDHIYITASGNTAALPMGTVHVLYVFSGHVDPIVVRSVMTILETQPVQFLDGGNKVLLYSGSGLPCPIGTGWYIHDNHIVFDCNLDGQEITVMHLTMPTDDNGYPLIDEEQVEAIGMFVELQLAERENNKRFIAGKLHPVDMMYVKSLTKKYHRLVGMSKATTTPSEKKEIAQMFNFPWTGSSNI